MKEITIVKSGRQLTEKDISELELKINVKLPSDYKSFLLLHNGGYPNKNTYEYYGIDISNQGSDVACFLAFYDVEVNFHGDIYDDILKQYYRYEDRIHRDFIPIAFDSGGNYICLGIKNSHYGMVYFWEHEEEVEYGEEPTFDNMYLIASNFTDFINSLYGFDIEGSINQEGVYIVEKVISTHDKYSILFSREAKKHGNLVLDFFAKAPDEVEDYIIEEKEDCEDRLLYYNVPEEGKRYNRLIKSNVEVDDYVSNIEEGREN